MLENILNKYRNNKYHKVITIAVCALLLYVIYSLYVFRYTESTDNAYVHAEISDVSSEIAGIVTDLLVSNNRFVHKGDVIAKLDSANYKANLIKAESDIVGAEQGIYIAEQKILIEQITLDKNKETLALAKITLEVSKSDYNRTIELRKEKFTSQKVLDTTKVAYTKALSDYTQAQLNLRLNEQNLLLLNAQKAQSVASLESLKQVKNLASLNLEKTEIRAPIDGVFSNNNLQVGNHATPPSILFSIVPDRIYIKANYKETQVEKFKIGMKVSIKFDSLSNKKFDGIIRSISPATGSIFSLLPPDNATGNFTKIVQRIPVLIDFDGSDAANIIPGMSARVSIRTDQ